MNYSRLPKFSQERIFYLLLQMLITYAGVVNSEFTCHAPDGALTGELHRSFHRQNYIAKYYKNSLFIKKTPIQSNIGAEMRIDQEISVQITYVYILLTP